MTKVVQARNSIQSLSSSRVPSVDLLAFNEDYLSEQLAGWDDRPFVRAEMQVEDETGRIALASREDLLDTQGVTLLTGLPGSGKTTLLAWAAGQRRAAGRGISVFIQLDEYARSGLSSIYEYAADQMQRGLRGTFQLPAGLNELRVAIIEQDRHGTLLWMVDSWDRLHPDERDRVLAGLSGLTHALVATTDTQEFIRRAKARSLGFPRQIYHVLPWGQSQQAEYLAQTARSQPSFGYDSAASLTQALPGLARLPAGMAYLTRHGDPSLTKTLLGFLDSQQQTRGGTPVRLNWRRNQTHTALDWGNTAVNMVFAGVTALMQAGLSARYEPERLAQIDRVILGACLAGPMENLESRMQRADRLLEAGVRAGLLTRVDGDSCAFVVPEMGYLRQPWQCMVPAQRKPCWPMPEPTLPKTQPTRPQSF